MKNLPPLQCGPLCTGVESILCSVWSLCSQYIVSTNCRITSQVGRQGSWENNRVDSPRVINVIPKKFAGNISCRGGKSVGNIKIRNPLEFLIVVRKSAASIVRRKSGRKCHSGKYLCEKIRGKYFREKICEAWRKNPREVKTTSHCKYVTNVFVSGMNLQINLRKF